MAEKKKEGSKHIYIAPKTHAALKERAKLEGKKIMPFANELLASALDFRALMKR